MAAVRGTQNTLETIGEMVDQTPARLPALQTGILMMRMAVYPRMTYMLRSAHTEVTQRADEDLDRALRAQLRTWLQAGDS